MISDGHRLQATRALSLALEAPGQSTDDLIRAARSAKQLGDMRLECAALAKAFEIGPIPQRLQIQLIDLCLKQDRIAEAEEIAARSAQGAPDAETLFLKWIACLEIAGRFDTAIENLRARTAVGERSEALATMWGRILIDRMQRPDLALAELANGAGHDNGDWSTCCLRGQALAALNRSDEALAQLHAASEIAPQRAKVWFELGKLQRRMGMAEESAASLRRVLQIDPFDVTALRLLGHDHQHVYGDAIFRTVNLVLAKAPELSRVSEVEAHYAAAKAYEDVSETAVAFAHYRRAGQLHKRLHPWNDSGMRRLVKALRTHANSSWLQAAQEQGYLSEKPVFIVGMPRSGTSLVEQIIAAHPDAFGAGELKLADKVLNGIRVGGATMQTGRVGDDVPTIGATTLADRGREYLREIEKIAGTCVVRITDKMPGNYMWIGLLAAILPGARFVHCRRHPVDTCLSQYKLYFGPEVPYSYDLRDLGKAYVAYDELTMHWANVLPSNKLLDVRYEQVVQDIEGESRRLIAFLDLSWNNSCLDFARAKRQVRTASALQVRRPIYQSSVNQWRSFETFLGPLLDELGNLPAAYDGL